MRMDTMARLASAGALQAGFEGLVLEPGDPGYEDARKIWNGMIDRHPAIIARCLVPADVGFAIKFARDRGLPIAVKGGGHNVTGNAMCDGGVAIDLSQMRRTVVDPEPKLVRVEGGALLGDLDSATQAHALATPVGINSTTGIAGLTLGGGIGHLMRTHGLTIDNLVGVEMVSALGEPVHASEDEPPTCSGASGVGAAISVWSPPSRSGCMTSDRIFCQA